jgi:acyl transferase domain-containing protein/thioesterase domain-containing protein
MNGLEIAVVGMAGRFPGAKNVDEFWQNIRDGVESISFFTDKELAASGIDPDVLSNDSYVKAKGVLEDIDLFDASFFGYSGREAQITDPQHRLFLECAWEALENSGYDPIRYEGLIGVYAGVGPNRYMVNNLYPNRDLIESLGDYQILIGNDKDYVATRVSYKLNLKGPSVVVQTACSTSLVALCMACQSLLSGECDMVLAGGATVSVPQKEGYFYEQEGILSPDGHCRAFDSKAQGTVLSCGVGIVVLKRLEEALVDGDCIHAVIKGSAINNDGSLKVGFTAPSVDGQVRVIRAAQIMAEIDPETITHVETHGTATNLGDPIEIAALTQAFRVKTRKKGYCAITSVKTNIGHTDTAAGIASLIKTVLTVKHKMIPPSLNFEEANPLIDFENSPFYVNTKLSEWKVEGFPRRAGVSSLGIGGTNAHVILEEAPIPEPSGKSRPWQLLLLSAKTSTALDSATIVGRKVFKHRRMAVCKDLNDALNVLDPTDSKQALTSYHEPIDRDVVFLFSGQGSQYVNMGMELYKTESIFQKHVDYCSEHLKNHLSYDLRDILYPEAKKVEESEYLLGQTFITQPALFVIEYALAKLWMAWGVRPAACAGHSIGEYVAACLAEVFSLEDALSLVATRGRLIQKLPEGSMLAVFLSEKEILSFLNEDLSLAAINGPSLCVVSGEKETVKNLEKKLSEKELICRYLRISHAFHSEMMDPILNTFSENVRQLRLHPPRIPFLSNLTGTWIKKNEAMDPDYWARHLRHTVRFADCLSELLKEPNRVLLEVGPGNTLNTLSRQHPDISTEHFVISSIRHPQERKSDVAHILNTLGQIWVAGVTVDWGGFYGDERRYRVPLPTYPFERERHWIEVEGKRCKVQIAAPSLSEELNTIIPPEELPKEDNLEQEDDIAPDNTERTITKIWMNLLGHSRIGINENFFGLGGNSLMAVRMFSQIEKKFGKRLPLSALYEAPTVSQLASILRNEEWTAPWSSLVEIQSGDSSPPLFLVHGAGGNILIYHDLALRIGSDQRVYGLQSKGLDIKQTSHTRVEDMASHYLKEIKDIQPQGPYFLGGYCLGGSIAYEMAQQLHEQGQETALLVLLETYNYSNIKPQSFIDNVYYYIQKVDFHLRNFLGLQSEEKLIFIKEKLKVARSRRYIWLGMIKAKVGNKIGSENQQALHLFNLWNINDQAAIDYVPKVYPGRITQFIPAKGYAHLFGPELGWDKLAAGGLETYQLPVYPAGMMVEPFVQLLAGKIKACIEKVSN